MAVKRCISVSISTSKKMSRILTYGEGRGEIAALLYTWIMPHTDDFGYFMADSFNILMNIFPIYRTLEEERVNVAVSDLEKAGLIVVHTDDSDRLIGLIVNFDEHQKGGIHKRTRPRYEINPNDNRQDILELIEKYPNLGKNRLPRNSRKFPEEAGISRNITENSDIDDEFREIPLEGKGREGNQREGNGMKGNVSEVNNHTLPPQLVDPYFTTQAQSDLAKNLSDIYKTIKSDGTVTGIRECERVLRDGASIVDVEASVKNYVASVRMKNTKEEFITKMNNFFKKGTWRDHVEFQVAADKPTTDWLGMLEK